MANLDIAYYERNGKPMKEFWKKIWQKHMGYLLNKFMTYGFMNLS